MTKKETSTAKPPITVSAGAEAPFLLYAGDDEKVHVRVLIHAETLWLPQRLMAELFQTTPRIGCGRSEICIGRVSIFSKKGKLIV